MSNKNIPDYAIKPVGEFSQLFLDNDVQTFYSAIEFVKRIRYGRNTDRANPLLIFKESRGTCSTKHAAIKRLCHEHGRNDILLILSIYRMNDYNTPAIKSVLQENGLNYIPEAHTYLKFHDRITDCTYVDANPELYLSDILEEIISQIGDFKIEYHKNYLQNWLVNNTQIHSLEDIWSIREKCIVRLTQNDDVDWRDPF